ncbi:MAG: alpha-L-fucosidase, partial [Spirochaetes bacterium]|nr:alpha-L-fucosidase [Spirochaetota bacterium]
MSAKSMVMNRRDFLGVVAGSAISLSLPKVINNGYNEIPAHLKGYEKLYEIDPRAASRQWFREAKFGLFMHYGVYSLLKHGEWVMLHEKIPVKEYEKLKDSFTADKFDADKITDLAVSAGMRYVNITSRHHDSFCLFRTKETDFNSLKSPAKRDLIDELAKACRKKGLGLFLYYSYACDWRHPYFYPNEVGYNNNARPHYEKPEPSYLWRKDEDFKHYIKFVHN